MSSFYSNCACSELLLGPGETSHGHREPHKAARSLLGAGTHALWQKQVGPGCAWYLFALDVLGHHRCGYCWKLPEELGAGPEGPAPSTCCLFTRMGGLGASWFTPSSSPGGGGAQNLCRGHLRVQSGRGLLRGQAGHLQSQPLVLLYSSLLGVECGQGHRSPYTPRLCLPRMRLLGLARLLYTKHSTSLLLNAEFARDLRAGLKALSCLYLYHGPPRGQTVGRAAMGILVGRFGYRF